MSDLRKYLNEQLKDPEFAAEYEAMRAEYEEIRAVIAARLACNMTQKELAEKRHPSIQYQPDRERGQQPDG